MELYDIKNNIKKILQEITEFDIEKINDGDLLFDEIGIQSIDVVQVFLSCEEKYNIEMHDAINMAAPLSINYIAQIVYNKINEKEDENNENSN